MGNKILPGFNQQPDDLTIDQILNLYSPRLFGAPPQLTQACDMRLMSSTGGKPGPVGDFYLSKILKDAQVANFVVGRARFLGGSASKAGILRSAYYYGTALKKYDVFGSDGNRSLSASGISSNLYNANALDAYKRALDDDDGKFNVNYGKNIAGLDLSSVDSDATFTELDGESKATISNLAGSILGSGTAEAAAFTSALLTSYSVQQPYYQFEANWSEYINNVKMMINTAIIMLGLQKGCVRIGDEYLPIGMNTKINSTNDVWSDYRAITPLTGRGDTTAIDTGDGDTSQYVSFMIDPTGVSESYTNTIGQSSIYSSVMNSGTSYGNEIAFLTNSAVTNATDKIISLGKDVKSNAESILKNLSSGNGRFTAAIMNSYARSFVGDHTIYPDIFQSFNSTSSIPLTIHLTSDAGDPYSYLINILVPMFFILGMALPQLSKNSAAAYSYPPVIQCHIPGLWGTRLGMIENVSFAKNTSGHDVSVNGYPLSVDVTITVRDLQHGLYTSPMNKPATFLNNNTMFDYIAQCAGVDKFRLNASMRHVTKLALAASAVGNTFHNIGDSILNDATSLVNRMTNFNIG